MNTDHVFDFIMDPQQLISKMEAAAYGGSKYEEEATLFFKRSDGEAEEIYSSRSDVLRISNAGTAAVNVSVTAYVSSDSVTGISMTDNPDFIDEDSPSLYLALVDEEEGENQRPLAMWILFFIQRTEKPTELSWN